MINYEEEKVIPIERAKELLVGTEYENAGDEEIGLLIESIKQFCEINLELYKYQQNKLYEAKEARIYPLEQKTELSEINKAA